MLSENGYVVIRDFDVNTNIMEECKDKFLAISELVGIPFSHDAKNTIIWDIKSNPSSNGLIKTYSEHSHDAELHTDSQYSENPEDYFGLLTLKKAACGGGQSHLLSLKDILKTLHERSDGKEIERTLRETSYPFIVPDVFKLSNNPSSEYNFGPILRDNEIRFRVDTFEKAIEANPELCTKQQLLAYNVLKEIVLNSPYRMHFHLNENDLIFINNKTMLHGRKGFSDLSRHLLRIRLNKINK